jgi:MGT family glycosyltransferase
MTHRFLFCPWSTTGDTMPFVALAQTLRARGHSVVFAASARTRDLIRRAGFEAYELTDSTRRSRSGSAALRHLLRPLKHQFAELSAIAARTQSDVVVDGAVSFAPRLMAEHDGLRHAAMPTMAWPHTPTDFSPALRRLASTLRQSRLAADLRAWNAVRASLNLAPALEHPWFDVPSRELILLTTTTALAGDVPGLPAHAHFVGPVLDRSRAVLADGLLAPGDRRPIVFVSQGTFFHASLSIVTRTLEALAREPVRVVVGAGRELTSAERARLPRNASAHAFVPIRALRGRMKLLVTHGGPGSVNEGLMAGVPLLVLPLAADQPEVARRVVAAGAGLRLDSFTATPRQIREAVRELLTTRKYRLRAAAIGRSYRRRDGCRIASDHLERLGGKTASPTAVHEADPERLRMMDGIVGRCVRDPKFAAAVLADPEVALERFQLTKPEMDDFRALLQYRQSARAGWAGLLAAMWPR